jgi:hypothetical protein
MEVSRIRLLIVTLVLVLSLVLGASPTLAKSNDGPAAFKCTQVFRDQMHTDGQPGNRNPNGPRTNCDHKR